MSDTETTTLEAMPEDFFELAAARHIGVPPESVAGDFESEESWVQWTRPSERLSRG